MNTVLLQYYGLREQPFGVTPDPRFLYASSTHREALASLLYGIESERGFLALVGPPGTGKTTLLFRLLEQFRTNARTAFLFHTQCDSREFLRYLLTDLGIAFPDASDVVSMHRRFNDELVQTAQSGQRCIVVVDEAQNLDNQVLETVRLLSDFETSRAKLLQIVIAGQPSLGDKLADSSLAQLRQRISMMCRLRTLEGREVEEYILHRLRTAGAASDSLFSAQARSCVAELSGGIPRVISNICFNAMSLAYATGQRQITSAMIREVGCDLGLDRAGAERLADDLEETDYHPTPEGPIHLRDNPATVQEDKSRHRHRIAHRNVPESMHRSSDLTAQPSGTDTSATGTAVITERESPAPETAERYKPASRKLSLPPAERIVLALVLIAAVSLLIFVVLLQRPFTSGAAESASSGTRDENAAAMGTMPANTPILREAKGGAPADGASSDHSARRSSGARVERSSPAVRSDSHESEPSDVAMIRIHMPSARPAPGVQSRELPAPNATTMAPPAGAAVPQLAGAAVALPRLSVASPDSHRSDTTEPFTATVLQMVKPIYPDTARLASIEGVVTLKALVGRDGVVKEVRVLDGHAALAGAAVDAVRKWRYQPYRQEGRAVEFETIVKMQFVLSGHGPTPP